MPRWVALLLSVVLVGCSGTMQGVRPGTGEDTLRLGLPGAPIAQSPPIPLQGTAGEGLVGDGIPRAVLRLVPQGATAVADAGSVAATGEALVAGGAVVAVGGSSTRTPGIEECENKDTSQGLLSGLFSPMALSATEGCLNHRMPPSINTGPRVRILIWMGSARNPCSSRLPSAIWPWIRGR